MESKHCEEKWILGGASGRMITTKSGYFGDGFIADVDTLANAKRIVTAVNAHDELVNALRKITEMTRFSHDNTKNGCGYLAILKDAEALLQKLDDAATIKT